MKNLSLIILFVAFCFSLSAQETKEKKWELNGYVKDMQTIIIGDVKENWITYNLIHNRLNFKWYPTDNFNLVVEARNRFIWGELLSMESLVPDSMLMFKYSDYIDEDNGFFDVSDNILKEKSFILHSALDRFYFDYTKGNFQVRIGRQRINWAQTFVWNPNDLFNNYSFFDFDYEEKPGSDAVRLQYYTGVSSQAEIAVKANHKDELTIAGFYRFNKWNYDIQFLGGMLNEQDYVMGAGWSGQILKGGFRGELSYFQPKENMADTSGIFVSSIGYDYTFKNSLFLQFEALYNSNGSSDRTFNLQEFYYQPLSAKNLSLNELTLFGMATYPISPLINASFSGMYSPNDKSLYLGPGGTFSISDNFDLNVSTQVFLSEQDAALGGGGAFVFMRMKWSF